ncbi:hypothetical protein KBB12_00250 [Candidatus Woesebacteria bacterium]|nr:hypothetical protein [Candidatus Woesebacteria bacterium]
MENTEKTLKPARKTTRSRAKPKEKVAHETPPVLEAELERTVKSQPSAEKIEDKISSVIIVAICVFFLIYVAYQTFVLNRTKGESSLTPPNRTTIPLSVINYDCGKHTGDFQGCVNAQVAGKGCSWFSDCSACIVGSHDGRSFKELCGKSR